MKIPIQILDVSDPETMEKVTIEIFKDTETGNVSAVEICRVSTPQMHIRDEEKKVETQNLATVATSCGNDSLSYAAHMDNNHGLLTLWLKDRGWTGQFIGMGNISAYLHTQTGREMARKVNLDAGGKEIRAYVDLTIPRGGPNY